MSWTLDATSRHSKYVYGHQEFVCDDDSDIQTLPTNCAAGSSAFVIATSKKYMLNTQKEWKEVAASSGSGGSGTASSITAAGDWDKEQSYEPNTAVTKDGKVYLSKKQVPAGTEIDNEEYWGLFLDSMGGDKNTVHEQIEPAQTWTIAHNLNKYPAITIVDDSGEITMGDISYVDENNVTITFSAPISGRVFLN